MKIDPMDPASHGKPLWVVYGEKADPRVLYAKLLAYTNDHRLLPAGTAGVVCIWGHSVWRRQPGFRTLGINVAEWSVRSGLAPLFFDTQAEAEIAQKKISDANGSCEP